MKPINHKPKIRYKFLTRVQSDIWTKEDKTNIRKSEEVKHMIR